MKNRRIEERGRAIVKDITKRKQMEKEIRDLARFPSENPNPILRLDAHGTILSANASCKGILQNWSSGIGQVAPKYWCDLVAGVLSTGQSRDIDFELNERSYTFLAKPIMEAGYVNLYGRDITARKKAEEALRENETKYRTLVDHSLQGIVIAQGPPPRLVFANPTMAGILGYTPRELTSLSPKETEALVHPEDRAAFFGRFMDRLQGKPAPARYEFRGIRKDGEERWLEISSNRIEYQGQPAVHAAFVDITERKRIQQTLEESEKRFKDVATSSADWIWEVDKNGKYTFASGNVEQILRYTPEELIGKTPFELMPEDEAKRVAEIFRQITSAKNPIIDLENWNVTKNGEKICLLTNGVPILDEKGDLLGYRGIDKDITERKRLEDTLKESEEKYRAMVENSPNLIGIFQDGVLKYVNSTGILKLGWTYEEIVSPSFDPIEKVVSQKSRSLLKENVGKRLRGEDVAPYEISLTKKDGSEVLVSVTAAKIIYNRKPAIEFVFDDITERKRLEDTLKESEERFREAMEATNDGLWDWNVETDEIYFSPAYNRMLGYEPGKLPEHVQSWKDLIHPDDRDRVVQVNEDCIENRIPKFEVEFRMRAKGGEWKWILGRGKATSRDANGHALRMIGTHVDITNRKRLVEEVSKSRQYLLSIIHNANVWLDVLDEEGNVQIWNQAAEVISGYSREEVVRHGKIWEWLYPDEQYRREVFATAKAIIEQGKTEEGFQTRIRRKDGQIRTISWNSRNLLDESRRSIGSIAIGQDVTERNRMEEELRQHTEHLKQLVEEKTREIGLARERLTYLVQSNPAVIYSGKPTADLSDFQLTYLSDRVVSMLGYEPAEFVGHPEFRTSHVHPGDLQPTLEAIQALWKEGQRSFEYRFQHKDGSYRWIREEAKVGRDVNGKPIEVYGYWTDATERMRLEEENRKLNAELTLRLTEVTDQVELLSKSRDRLKAVPDVTSGLDIILDSVLWGFGLDFGAVLVLDRQENRVNVRASKGKGQEIRLDDTYPLGSFVELKDLQTKSMTKFVGEGDRSIFGAATVQIIPILSGKELYGLLAFGSAKNDLLDASSMRILELYAELVYSFMVERSLSIIPARELTRAGGGAGDLEPGQMYLVKKDPAKAFDIFTSTVFGDYEGLCITRMYPPKMRSKYGLEKTPIIWLTGEASEGERSVQSIQDLSIVIGDFLDKARKPVILLDGFEYLVTNSGFDSFIRFLQVLKDRLQRKSGVLIAPILEEALGPKELALLHRETVTLAEQE